MLYQKARLEDIGCVVEPKEIVPDALWLKVTYGSTTFYLKPVLSKSNKYFGGHRILSLYKDGRIQGWGWKTKKEFEALLKLVLGN